MNPDAGDMKGSAIKNWPTYTVHSPPKIGTLAVLAPTTRTAGWFTDWVNMSTE